MVQVRKMTQLRNQKVPPVTIAILNYNGRKYLQETICSIQLLDYSEKQIIMVDDGSTDDSIAFVQDKYPDVRIIQIGYNTGMLNKVRNLAISNAPTNIVLITDNDITFSRDCLRILVDTMSTLPDAAILTPRVMYQDEKDRIYIDYNPFHYICISIDKNRGKKLQDIENSKDQPRHSFGCGIMLLDKTKTEAVNFFDEDYVMGWGDDGEFHHRMNLSGLRCYAVPDALVYHKAVKGKARIYGQVRNRWYIILQTYSLKTILLISPALLVYELSLFCFLSLNGSLIAYLRAVRDVLSNYRELMEKRKKVQSYKVLNDKDFMTSGDIFIPSSYKTNPVVNSAFSFLNTILNIYWQIIKRFL
jgi:GT2 family glycosyltransferase